jgi:uncharacterized protein
MIIAVEPRERFERKPVLPPLNEAYLDIETTGLSNRRCSITVVGMYLVSDGEGRMVQLVGDEISGERIMAALVGTRIVYTFNGSRFDLPFIHAHTNVNLEDHFLHRDLMRDCRQQNLHGGLKAIERHLGIPRKLTEVDGYGAIQLWWRYVNDYDTDALKTLLEYNKEDVVNLQTLKEKIL